MYMHRIRLWHALEIRLCQNEVSSKVIIYLGCHQWRHDLLQILLEVMQYIGERAIWHANPVVHAQHWAAETAPMFRVHDPLATASQDTRDWAPILVRVVLGQKWFCGHGFTVLALMPFARTSRRPLKPSSMAVCSRYHKINKAVIDGTPD
jgi:hypothetical protein